MLMKKKKKIIAENCILDSFIIDVYINQKSVCYEILIITIIFATTSYHEIVKIFKLFF